MSIAFFGIVPIYRYDYVPIAEAILKSHSWNY